MTEHLINHTEQQKKSLIRTISNRLRLGFDELSHTIWIWSNKKDSNEVVDKKIDNKNQITAKEEKDEKKLIEKRKNI